ncbi:MAG: hypothetical protein ACI9JD_003486 [Rhodococcus sp. (in: high G+C Gram-positive bacteria)]|jgi:hypothetical protein
MVDASRVRTLTEQALDNFDNPGMSVAALVRQAQRIAVLRNDYAAELRFFLESRETGSPDPVRKDRALDYRRKLEELLGQNEGLKKFNRIGDEFIAARRLVTGKKQVTALSIDQIEQNVTTARLRYQELSDELSLARSGVKNRSIIEIEDAKSTTNSYILEMTAIVEKIRQSVFDFLTKTESELDSGRINSDFFDGVFLRINSAMEKYAPDAVEKFVAAQERISDGGSEDISHALTSCRRMIKSLADALYPASKEKIAGLDGIKRSMTDDVYKNRLLQYVVEKVGKHKDGEVLQSVVTDLGSRLDALDGLASKGVHADATLAEAHTCIIQTYMLAGSLLAIADGTSHLMQDDESTASE